MDDIPQDTWLPEPNSEAKCRLHQFIDATGLLYNSSAGHTTPALGHCLTLCGTGVIITASTAPAPCLTDTCTQIASKFAMPLILMRCGPHLDDRFTLLTFAGPDKLIAREGYRAVMTPQGCRFIHPCSDAPPWLLNPIGLHPVQRREVAPAQMMDRHIDFLPKWRFASR